MISGTSHDGIDAAIVDFVLGDDGVLAGTVGHHDVTPYDPALRTRLRAALPPASTSLAEVCELDTLIGQAFAAAAASAIAAGGPVDAICSHGQTVFHWVEGGVPLGTLQLGQPAWIAERTGVPVVSDVRIRDITVGGHGAPLVPLLDTMLLRGAAADRTVGALNLGGISNMTVVAPGAAPVAYDIGPANTLLDAVAVERGVGADGPGYDEGGRLAASGRVDTVLLALLLDEPYYVLPAPKSTGKELFNADYVVAALARRADASAGAPADVPGAGTIATADLLATLTELTARTVADAVIAAGVELLVVSGGGAANDFMLERIAANVPSVAVTTTAEFGAPIDVKEAIAFALIGWCTLHGVTANEPSATGASAARILGTVTPGAGPLVLPSPVTIPVTAVRLA